jgi:hypothetical protein
VRKPDELHARDRQWTSLAEFGTDPAAGATLGLVYGRRRQGKTLMLELLAEATGGLMFTAREQSDHQNLADLSAAYAAYTGQPSTLRLGSWQDLIEALVRIGTDAATPVPVILDEFPHLVAQAPSLPSLIQIALSPRSFASRRTRTRLILCGSALSVMRDLLGNGAPLRGRAKLELVLRPFDFREAASFWGLESEPELAFRVNALLGGTPAYRAMTYGPPGSLKTFDRWVAERLLNPASAIFREGNLLLREEAALTDPTPYHAVLTAIAGGATRRSEIAGLLGRPATGVGHLLEGLEQVGLITRLEDALRQRRGAYRLTDPLIRLHSLVIERNEGALVRGRGARVWASSASTVASMIYGPHFEDLAREWCVSHAHAETLGGEPNQVLPAVAPCRTHGQGHELDVVVIDHPANQQRRVIAIGEAKATSDSVDQTQLRRLEHLRDLVPAALAPVPARLLLFSRSGFMPELRREAATRGDIELVDLDRLYNGA